MNECKIAEKLVQCRLAKGVTQDEVARSLSVSNKTVSKWETGTSMPDLPMLAELSKYFNVTTDSLLGLSDGKTNGTKEAVRSAFEGLDWKGSVLKMFEMESAVIPAIYETKSRHGGDTEGNENAYPSECSRYSRSQISTRELFKLAVSSEDVNLSVTLLRNKNDFAWLREPEKQQRLADFFRFLSEGDVFSVLYFIHSTDCDDAFTADYVSANTGVPKVRVSAILKQFCDVGACRSLPAHLAEGDVDVYECPGDGIMLSVISLAYDKIYGKPNYLYYFNGGCRMIGGK